MVGKTLNSEKDSRLSIAVVPRCIARDRPPVWRSRWNFSDRLCRWRKTCSAIWRMARCDTFWKIAVRGSVKDRVAGVFEELRHQPRAAIGRAQPDRDGHQRRSLARQGVARAAIDDRHH